VSPHDGTRRRLLLSYVSLLAERHAYGPADGFEFRLWDDLLRAQPTLVSLDEKYELVSLIMRTDAWVTYDLASGRLQLIDLDAWRIMLEHRDH
jgi:hypothetical protein